MSNAGKKAFFIIFWVVYNLLWLWGLAPGFYANILYMIALLVSFGSEVLDTIVRPITQEREQSKKAIILLVGFLSWPLFLIAGYWESELLVNQYLAFWRQPVVTHVGIGLMVIGTVILVVSRLQLGKFATGLLVIEKDHTLYTGGLYKYIRHPIYLGGTLVNFGMMVSLQSVLFTCLQLVIGLLITRDRMNTEERMLLEQFGQEYDDYMARTKRILPHLY